jgi:hypothetical protein
MLRRVALVRTDIFEESSAPIISDKSQWTMNNISCN